MRLIKVQVERFRNIIDSTPVEIEEDITCLVGKNESGKTAFLHALYRLNPVRENVGFSVHDHYPAWLAKRHKLKGVDLKTVTPISATFVLEDEEVSFIEETLGLGVLSNNEVVFKRDYAGNAFCEVSVDEGAAVKHFLTKVQLPQRISSELEDVPTIEEMLELIERMQTRENVSDDDKEKLSKGREIVLSTIGEKGLLEYVQDRLKGIAPQFFYFDEYSTLPYSVDIQRLLKTKEDQLDEGELTARSLLRIASADDDYLTTSIYERRKRELENLANALTDDVLQYWTQNDSLRVLPDITQKTVSRNQGPTAVLDEIKFRIWDDRHMLSLPFNEHSSGFQWFFSFLAAFSEFELRDTPVVILLDEPALGLHARAQKDFLRFIEERLASSYQVIYTTHSPFMVQPDHLERVRIVEDKSRDEGAKVTMDVMTTDPDTLFPLQGALGYDMAQHLFLASHNLVVEGTSDYTYLSVFSDYLQNESERVSLDERWSIVPVGGADLIPSFVALLGNHLDVTVLVDSQRAGHQKLSRLASRGYLGKKRIVSVGQILGRKLADIEDLFEVEDYLNIYNQAFSDSIDKSDLTGTDPIVSRIARYKGVPRFDHGKPADYLLRNRDQLLPKMSQKTITNFERLFIRLNSTLLSG